MTLYRTILAIYKKDIKFSMRFKTYLLIAIASIWLVFGAMFLYRSCWDLEDAKMVHGSIVEFGVKEFDEGLHQYALCFKVHGSNQTFGFYQRKNQLYTEQIPMFKIGDSAKVYYNDWKLKSDAINLQLVHLETSKHVILNYTDRKYRDRWIGIVFVLAAVAVGGLTWLLIKKKLLKPNNEFLGI